MDIFFADPSEVPLPPNEVRIRELRAEPWPDGRRVHIYLEVDPFQLRPNADLVIKNDQGDEVSQINIIESMDRKIEATMHLRVTSPSTQYKVFATLYYANIDESTSADSDYEPIERQIVDRAQAEFGLPQQVSSD
jgi:hypothetical protein